MVCHGLLGFDMAIFFCFLYLIYRLLGGFRQKNIKPLTNEIYTPKNLNEKELFKFSKKFQKIFRKNKNFSKKYSKKDQKRK